MIVNSMNKMHVYSVPATNDIKIAM